MQLYSMLGIDEIIKLGVYE